jgi:hypothetical protein
LPEYLPSLVLYLLIPFFDACLADAKSKKNSRWKQSCLADMTAAADGAPDMTAASDGAYVVLRVYVSKLSCGV